jgi:hypothetical protein
MRSKLKSGERCPLHHSIWCSCHGQTVDRQPLRSSGPVRRVDDPHYPRGYRELCSPAELKRRKDILIRKDPSCIACGETFTEYAEIELAHKSGKGMGSGKRDDHWENLVLMHAWENREQGSRSLEQYLADKQAALERKHGITSIDRIGDGQADGGTRGSIT